MKTKKRKSQNQKTIIIKEKMPNKRQSNFWKNFYSGIKKWFVKYHIPVFTFSISVFASIGVVAYSAIGGEKLFPSFTLGFMLILILEFGFVTLRYIAVSIGASRITMFFINIFMLLLFILTIAPATIGINQKVQEDREGPGAAPERSSLISSLEKNNTALNDKITENTRIMKFTTSNKIFNELKIQNENFIKSMEENKQKITEKENTYETELKAWNNKKRIAESKDPFVMFMRDFYLRFMIPGVQVLNFFMSVLGAGYLRKIKHNTITEKQTGYKNITRNILNIVYKRIYAFIAGKEIKDIEQEFSILINNKPEFIPVDGKITDRLADHEKRMESIEKHTEKVLSDMEELAGELNIPVKTKDNPRTTRNSFKDKDIEKKSQDASRPVFFTKKIELNGKKR